MHIADFFTRRKYDKKERISKSEEEYQREGKQCHTCGDHFDSDIALEDHIKRKHPGTS